MDDGWEDYLPAWLIWAARSLADLAGVILVFMMSMIVVDIVGRTLGFGSIESVIELSSLSVLFIVCFGLAGCTAAGGHILIDLFTRTNRPRTNRIIDAFWLLVMGGIVGLIAWYSMREALITHATGERSEVLQWSPLLSSTPAVIGLALSVVVALTIGIGIFRRLVMGVDVVKSERE